MNCSCESFLKGTPVDLHHRQIHQGTDSATAAAVLWVKQVLGERLLGMVEFGKPDYEMDCLSQTGWYSAFSLFFTKDTLSVSLGNISW